MSSPALIPASLSFVDGIPYADAFGDVYHSADGGLAQARHVFLAGNHLPARWRGRARFTMLETGFGLGLNFLATWNAWRADPNACSQLHYLAIEKHPFSAKDLAQLHKMWPELAELSGALRAAWPPLVPGFHRLMLEGGRIILTLVFGDITDCLPQIDMRADAFYLDGFSPDKNPAMWSPNMLERLNRLAAVDATLATYTVSAAVRRALTHAGFVCQKMPGFGRKREMLSARFTPRWLPQLPPFFASKRHAIVIGAGLAGCAASERLASRGWRVTLIERHARIAQEASGNLAGIVMPLLSKDDNSTSRLLRAAYLFTLQLWQRRGGIGTGFAGEACGVLQLALDAADAQAQRETATRFAYPVDYARWLMPDQAAALLGGEASHGGWLFSQGGWVHPASFCDAMLAACEDRLTVRFETSVAGIERHGEHWRVMDAAGAVIDQAPVVILANGTNATFLPQTKDLPLSAMRGQVTHLPALHLPELPIVVCGAAYMTRRVGDVCCVGATYDPDEDPALRRDSHEDNLARLAQTLPEALRRVREADMKMAGRVGFRCVTPDRLPLVGALPDAMAPIAGTRLSDVPRLPGVFGLLGYGSRGLIWAPFAAEIFAARLEGEPLPVERELMQSLDPARFGLKAFRRGR